MLKLMKYEFRKWRTTLLALALGLVVLEAVFLVGVRLDKGNLIAVSLGLLSLLVFATYAYILISGIVSYSRELKDRSGYLIFMTPVRPIGIVLSKLVFTGLTAIVATGVFGLAAYLDYAYLARRLDLDASLLQQVDFMLQMGFGDANLSINSLGTLALFTLLTVLIEVLLAMCTAYLAITLSATLLQNKKGVLRSAISVALFAGLTWGCSWLTDKLLYRNVDTSTTMARLTAVLGWSLLLNLGLCAVFTVVSAWLLDKKVNL